MEQKLAFDVAHIISSKTPFELLDQLALTCEPFDKIISVGKPLRETFPAKLEILQPAFGVQSLAISKIENLINLGSILHVWSDEMVELAVAVAKKKKCEILLSVMSVNSNCEENKLPWIAGANNIKIITRTQAGVKSCLDIGADPTKFASVPLAADVVADDHISSTRIRVRRELGIDDKTTVLAVPADVLTPESGQKIAIWAHAILSWVVDDIYLIVPGNSDEFDTIYKFATNTGFVDRIHFTKDEFTPAEVISACDIAVFAGDENHKNLGRIAESIMQSCPTIVDDCAEITEITNAGQLAKLVSVEPKTVSSAMLELIENSDITDKLITSCKSNHSKFSPENAKSALAEIYKSLVKDSENDE